MPIIAGEVSPGDVMVTPSCDQNVKCSQDADLIPLTDLCAG